MKNTIYNYLKKSISYLNSSSNYAKQFTFTLLFSTLIFYVSKFISDCLFKYKIREWVVYIEIPKYMSDYKSAVWFITILVSFVLLKCLLGIYNKIWAKFFGFISQIFFYNTNTEVNKNISSSRAIILYNLDDSFFKLKASASEIEEWDKLNEKITLLSKDLRRVYKPSKIVLLRSDLLICLVKQIKMYSHLINKYDK